MVIAMLNASELLPASLLTTMSASLDVSEGIIGQSVTATAILAILSSLLIAPLTRRIDRRPLLLFLGAALVISNAVVALAPDATVLLAARLVLGITVGGVWGLAASLTLRLVPAASVSRALSIVFGGATVATIAAAPLGAFFGEVIGWRGVFLVVAALSALAVLWQAFALPKMPPREGAGSDGLMVALRLPWLVPGLLGVMLFWGGAQSFNTYIRPYLETVTGLDAAGVSVVLFLFGIASFIGTILAAPLMQWNLRSVLPAAAAGQAILLALLLAFGQSWVAAAVFIASWGLFVGLAGVGWSTWVTRSYPENAERAGGLLVAAIQGSMMLGALLGGALIDNVSPTAPLTAGIAILAAAAIYVGVIMRVARDRA
ncbi:MFS transporter [Kineosporia sp. J2-2]|uniref:MFS transporter n=1 Tax=Kineosporia corallincola TaxID=2835133 RepID=A0ABS5TTT1_9ACTN|nr:MFS transporter [Kineosporia corallincola]MBT0774188.1 MFS transporter [Kineosporia corallincola]